MRRQADEVRAADATSKLGVFMLPVCLSGVQPQPPHEPSDTEADYGSSGRPCEVGAVLRHTPTFVTIVAQPSQPVRRGPCMPSTPRHSPRRHARPTGERRPLVTYIHAEREADEPVPLNLAPTSVRVCHEKRHRVRVRENRA